MVKPRAKSAIVVDPSTREPLEVRVRSRRIARHGSASGSLCATSAAPRVLTVLALAVGRLFVRHGDGDHVCEPVPWPRGHILAGRGR